MPATNHSNGHSNGSVGNEAVIVATDVEKWYDNGFNVLKGVSLDIFKGEVVVVMGPSGSGKSTFIRTFNALEPYQKGKITIDGIEISHDLKNIDRPRDIGRIYPVAVVHALNNRGCAAKQGLHDLKLRAGCIANACLPFPAPKDTGQTYVDDIQFPNLGHSFTDAFRCEFRCRVDISRVRCGIRSTPSSSND